jgi:hypothetical protein
LEQIGLINNIFTSAFRIDDGRKGFAVPGKERQGRISYENGEPKKRVQGFPLDVFHQARLRNILRAPGIEMLEKALLKQRAANMKTAQSAYVEKQRKALVERA